jgi:hypothetical protein
MVTPLNKTLDLGIELEICGNRINEFEIGQVVDPFDLKMPHEVVLFEPSFATRHTMNKFTEFAETFTGIDRILYNETKELIDSLT